MRTAKWHRLVAATGAVALTLTACGSDEPEEALGDLPEDIDWRSYVDLRPLHAAQEAVGLERSPADLDG